MTVTSAAYEADFALSIDPFSEYSIESRGKLKAGGFTIQSCFSLDVATVYKHLAGSRASTNVSTTGAPSTNAFVTDEWYIFLDKVDPNVLCMNIWDSEEVLYEFILCSDLSAVGVVPQNLVAPIGHILQYPSTAVYHWLDICMDISGAKTLTCEINGFAVSSSDVSSLSGVWNYNSLSTYNIGVSNLWIAYYAVPYEAVYDWVGLVPRTAIYHEALSAEQRLRAFKLWEAGWLSFWRDASPGGLVKVTLNVDGADLDDFPIDYPIANSLIKSEELFRLPPIRGRKLKIKLEADSGAPEVHTMQVAVHPTEIV